MAPVSPTLPNIILLCNGAPHRRPTFHLVPACRMQSPLTDAQRASLADAIDRLMSVDVPGRGFVADAYAEARRLAGGPLVRQAGDALLARLEARRGAVVLIATGATAQRPGLPDHIGEMDGPPGALALARTLGLAFGALPVLVTDPRQGTMLSGAAASLGLYTFSHADLRLQASRMPHVSAIAVVEMPDDDAAAREQSERLVASLDPVALIAIEKAGRNEKGVFHNSYKDDTSAGKARLEPLFDLCAARGVLTIGIGDGGNELGMGSIRDFILGRFDHMRSCNCPCGGSIVAEQKADVLLVATVSNWGAYGLTAYLAAVAGKPYAAHSPERERQLLRGCATAGYVHVDGFRTSAADGLPEDIHAAFVALLGCMTFWPPLQFGRMGILADMLAK